MIYGTSEFDELLKDVISNKLRHEYYNECCEHAEEMSWHLYGVKPIKLLERTRPNEDQEIKDYRLENYEPITKSAADKAMNIVSKIFNPNLYSVRWKDQTPSSEELKKYTLEYYPSYNSIVTFLKDVLLRKMLADPNGVAVVTVDTVPYLQSERLEPVLKIYGSKSVVYQDEDHYLMLRKIEDEKIHYFDYFDKDRTVSFYAYVTQARDGKGQSLVLVEEKHYQYNFDQIPVWKLRGMSESLDNGEIIFKSFFSSAVPFWNNAITHESDVFASYIRHMYPQRYELTEACNHKLEYEGQMYACRSGTIVYPPGKMKCPNCEGSGYRPVTPYGVYQYTKDKLSESGPLGVDPVGYITVPTDATKMLDERSQRMLKEGMWAINMDVEDEVGENQSGIAKVIDRSAQYDTLYNIGGVVFDIHLTNFYYFANKFMFGVEAVSSNRGDVDKNLPEINKPTQFDIGSVSEAIDNLKAARDAGLDNDIIQVKQIEVASRDLTTNPDLKQFATLMLELDPLPGMTQVDVDRNVSRGYVRKVDAVIHFNKKAFLERAIREDKNFIEKPRDQQILKLEEYANVLIKENKPVLDMDMLNVA